MSKVRGQRRQVFLHVFSGPVKPTQCKDGESMAQVQDPWTCQGCPAPKPDLATQLHEHFAYGRLMEASSLLRNKEGWRVVTRQRSISQGGVLAERVAS